MLATIPVPTRSALHRRLQRHGVRRLPDTPDGNPARKRYKPNPIGYFHAAIPEVQTAEGKLNVFCRHRPHCKFGFAQFDKEATRVTASAFLGAPVSAVPYRIHTALTGNGIQFRFAPRYADGPTARYIAHMVAMGCHVHGTEHRYNTVNHLWTNGQVERMNRTIKDATVRRFHYDSHSQLEQHLD